jgi:hypothetical protein
MDHIPAVYFSFADSASVRTGQGQRLLPQLEYQANLGSCVFRRRPSSRLSFQPRREFGVEKGTGQESDASRDRIVVALPQSGGSRARTVSQQCENVRAHARRLVVLQHS